jgi:hypothetical protein
VASATSASITAWGSTPLAVATSPGVRRRAARCAARRWRSDRAGGGLQRDAPGVAVPTPPAAMPPGACARPRSGRASAGWVTASSCARVIVPASTSGWRTSARRDSSPGRRLRSGLPWRPGRSTPAGRRPAGRAR